MNYKIISIDDSKDFCQCCGRTGLKRVVFIENLETNEIKHFGTTCAASPKNGFVGIKDDLKKAIKSFDEHLALIRSMTTVRYRRNGGKYVKDGDVFKAADQELLNRCRDEILKELNA